MITLTVKRPNGVTETVEAPQFCTMNDGLFAKIKKATKDGGKGDVLSWALVSTTKAQTEAEMKKDAAEREYYASLRDTSEGNVERQIKASKALAEVS